MQNFLREFKHFAMRGNVVDLAVGIIIGAAFQKIISSLVGDVMMPLLGFATGRANFTDIRLGPIAIGNFIQATIDFLIVAFVVFLVVRIINRIKHRHEDQKPENMSQEQKLLTEIRDLLKKEQK